MAVTVFFLIVFLQSLGLALLLTPFSIWLAKKTDHYDHPGHRKIHYQPHPVLGGLAIFLAFNITILMDLFLVKFFVDPAHIPEQLMFLEALFSELQTHLPGIGLVEKKLYVILLGGLLIFLVGLWDDRYSLKPKWKLLAQFLAALLLVQNNIQFDLFPQLPIVNKTLTVFWIVGLSNAFNLLDNMDGLTAGVAAIVTLFFAACARQMQQTFVVLIFLAFLGALMGFLHFNKSPAKTFMGDAGAMFIGYIIGGLSVLTTFYNISSQTTLALAKPLVILAVPAFDTLSVLFIRMKNHKPLFLGDKNHFSHRLVALGMAHKNAVLFIYLVTFCTGLGALLIRKLDLFGALIVIGQVVIIFAIIALLERVKTREDK